MDGPHLLPRAGMRGRSPRGHRSGRAIRFDEPPEGVLLQVVFSPPAYGGQAEIGRPMAPVGDQREACTKPTAHSPRWRVKTPRGTATARSARRRSRRERREDKKLVGQVKAATANGVWLSTRGCLPHKRYRTSAKLGNLVLWSANQVPESPPRKPQDPVAYVTWCDVICL